jgi:hypothetical protein
VQQRGIKEVLELGDLGRGLEHRSFRNRSLVGSFLAIPRRDDGAAASAGASTHMEDYIE